MIVVTTNGKGVHVLSIDAATAEQLIRALQNVPPDAVLTSMFGWKRKTGEPAKLRFKE